MRADRRESDGLEQRAYVRGGFAVVAGELDLAEAERMELAQRAFEIFLRFGLHGPQLDAERNLDVMVGEHGGTQRTGSRTGSSRQEK